MKLTLSAVFISTALSASVFTPSTSANEAILAGGCFWCMESDFEKLDGVTDVVSGFTGGSAPNPTYNGNHKGHFEAVKITYDGGMLSYNDILDHFWVNIDPFDDRGQFCDKGPSYLSAIFVANDKERAIAEKTKGDEIGHQDFYKKSPVRYKFYRWNCGRDQRLEEIWGEKALGKNKS